jgi:hypothetical protein
MEGGPAGARPRSLTEPADGPGHKPALHVPPRLPAGAAVRVHIQRGQIELQFDRGFTSADLDVVRSVPGRKWRREQGAWLLPDTPATQQTLERSFGDRLIRSGPGDAGRSPDRAEPAPLPPRALPPAPQRPPTAPPAAPPVSTPDPIAGRTKDRVVHPPAAPAPSTRVPRPSSSNDGTVSALPAAGEGLGCETGRILEALRKAIRLREYSRKTERAYVGWVTRFLRFHGRSVDLAERLDASHARAFLEHLATKGTSRRPEPESGSVRAGVHVPRGVRAR